MISARTSLIVSAVLIAALAGCSDRRDASREGDERRATTKGDEEAQGASTLDPPLRVFDAQGRLIPSNEYIAGIRLPRGAELFRADEVTHVYRIRAPIEKVLQYIGPMMITGKVERRGKGAIYRRASVKGAEVNPTKVDVSILDVGSNLVRIAVTELPPPPAYVPNASQTKAAARESWRMLD
jgi:hypothetical protein